MKQIKVLGVYFNLIIDECGDYGHFFDNTSKTITIKLKNIGRDLEEAIYFFYKSIFFEKILPIIKDWKLKITNSNINNSIDIKDFKEITIAIKYKEPEKTNIITTKKCEKCGNIFIIKTNSKNGKKFLACSRCSNTKNLEYNSSKIKNGFILKINPKYLCQKPLEEIDCLIVRNLVQTYTAYKSVKYWKEILKIYPNYFYVMKIETLDKELKEALEQIINESTEQTKIDYQQLKIHLQNGEFT